MFSRVVCLSSIGAAVALAPHKPGHGHKKAKKIVVKEGGDKIDLLNGVEEPVLQGRDGPVDSKVIAMSKDDEDSMNSVVLEADAAKDVTGSDDSAPEDVVAAAELDAADSDEDTTDMTNLNDSNTMTTNTDGPKDTDTTPVSKKGKLKKGKKSAAAGKEKSLKFNCEEGDEDCKVQEEKSKIATKTRAHAKGKAKGKGKGKHGAAFADAYESDDDDTNSTSTTTEAADQGGGSVASSNDSSGVYLGGAVLAVVVSQFFLF